MAETNDHVDIQNHTIQSERRRLGHLAERTARVAGGEAVAICDVVVTRRNARTIHTTGASPVATATDGSSSTSTETAE